MVPKDILLGQQSLFGDSKEGKKVVTRSGQVWSRGGRGEGLESGDRNNGKLN